MAYRIQWGDKATENSRWRRIVLNGASGRGVSQSVSQWHRLAANEEATLWITVKQHPNKEAENNRFNDQEIRRHNFLGAARMLWLDSDFSLFKKVH